MGGTSSSGFCNCRAGSSGFCNHGPMWEAGQNLKQNVVLCPPDGESAPDGCGGLGEVVRSGLQHQRGGGGHRSGGLPPAGGLRGSVRRHESPASPALLRILLVQWAGLCLVFHSVLLVPEPEPVHDHPVPGLRAAVLHLLCLPGSEQRPTGESICL